MALRGSLKVILLALALIVACIAGFVAGWARGCHRTVVWLESPQGDRAAWVEERASLDPPAQSLWIGLPDAQGTRVATLAEDQEWADQIFWDSDGRLVGFLVRGETAQIYDAERKEIIGRVDLVRPVSSKGTPTRADALEARNVRFADGTSELAFTECERGRARCFGERRVAFPSASP